MTSSRPNIPDEGLASFNTRLQFPGVDGETFEALIESADVSVIDNEIPAETYASLCELDDDMAAAENAVGYDGSAVKLELDFRIPLKAHEIEVRGKTGKQIPPIDEWNWVSEMMIGNQVAFQRDVRYDITLIYPADVKSLYLLKSIFCP